MIYPYTSVATAGGAIPKEHCLVTTYNSQAFHVISRYEETNVKGSARMVPSISPVNVFKRFQLVAEFPQSQLSYGAQGVNVIM